MTREKALQVDHLLVKIETYESLLGELSNLSTLDEIYNAYGEDLESELTAVVQSKLDVLLKELEEM
jgi:hypothetical protein